MTPFVVGSFTFLAFPVSRGLGMDSSLYCVAAIFLINSFQIFDTKFEPMEDLLRDIDPSSSN